MQSHLWTVLPRARHHLAPPPALGGEPWSAVVQDPDRGAVPLAGWLRRPPGSGGAVVLVHGLGGSVESPYVASATRACEAAGLATLRLGLRGSDGRGGDFYHAGLTADLEAAFASPALAGFDRLHLLGFSLGGHLALRYACERPDPRLRAVAAVCAPLDLGLAQRAFDRLAVWPYRRYVLGRLKRSYAALAAVAEQPTPADEVLRVRTLRDFDRLTVVPRFGFADPDDYYRRASVAPLLPRLATPALLVACPGDPMVSSRAIECASGTAPGLDLRWVRRGGHIGFPAGLDLGEAGPPGLDSQVAAWLRRWGRPEV
jgi:predicted alpha/beta-fold hydrolase